MLLLPDFLSAIAQGIGALRVEQRRLLALESKTSPEQLLALRDVGGLLGRLEETSLGEWRQGSALSFAPQDLGVLDELEAAYRDSPYAEAHDLAPAFGHLRIALAWYLDNHFALFAADRPNEEL